MHHRRIRKIGERVSVMPLPDSYPKGVIFVGRGSGAAKRIAGTGFLVAIDGFPYVVTAYHIVEGVTETFVRVPLVGGGIRDLPVPDWIPHGKHDIAVAPLDYNEEFDLVATGVEDQFINSERPDDEKYPVELGSVVYFLGLLGKVKAMSDRNIPVVRSGVLSCLWQDELPVKRTPRDKTKLITAHLIDCRSFGGFSGSPCYVQMPRVSWIDRGYGLEYRTLLLGLIGGHFDDWMGTRTRTLQGEGADPDEAEYAISDDLQAPVSTGIGYVIPAEFIRETLMREELVRMREDEKRAADEAARREDDDNAATMDSMEGASEFERFEDLTRKLVNTPKSKPEPDGDGS
jgi:Trypsin-like peptidase domain